MKVIPFSYAYPRQASSPTIFTLQRNIAAFQTALRNNRFVSNFDFHVIFFFFLFFCSEFSLGKIMCYILAVWLLKWISCNLCSLNISFFSKKITTQRMWYGPRLISRALGTRAGDTFCVRVFFLLSILRSSLAHVVRPWPTSRAPGYAFEWIKSTWIPCACGTAPAYSPCSGYAFVCVFSSALVLRTRYGSGLRPVLLTLRLSNSSR